MGTSHIPIGRDHLPFLDILRHDVYIYITLDPYKSYFSVKHASSYHSPDTVHYV